MVHIYVAILTLQSGYSQIFGLRTQDLLHVDVTTAATTVAGEMGFYLPHLQKYINN